MNMKRTIWQTRPCPGNEAARIVGGWGDPARLSTRVRALCIIRLVGLLVFAGVANICAAAESPVPGNGGSTSGGGTASGYATGPIRDPRNPESYMADLASRLNDSDGKGLLMKGVTQQKTQKPVSSPVTTVSPKATVSAVAPATPAAKPVKTPGVEAGRQNPQTVKKEPVSDVPTMMVWNGLSPDNRAAQRAIEHLEASRAAKASVVSPSAGNTGTDAASEIQTAKAAQVSPLNQTLMSAKPGLTLWGTPTPANLAEKVVVDPSAVTSEPKAAGADPNAPEEQAPWSLGADLDKYRAHAVKEGARDAGESLKKALERAGMAVGDGVNVFILGYGSDRAKPFRVNDGKGLFDEPGKVPQRVGTTAVSFADGVYSLADLVALDSLPDPLKEVYKDNNPLVRPLIFTGRTIGGVWKTTEEVGNAVTWGYFDNVTGCVGIVIEDIMELLKHVGQAATNLVRVPVELVAGKKEGVERAMDWILLVPLEFVTNSVQMKGIANMDDYTTAFRDKGVIGSVLELGGSTFIVYRMVDELVEKLENDHHHHRNSSASEAETPTDPPADTPTVTPGTGSELLFLVDGEWPNMITDGGLIYFDGPLPVVTVIIE